MRSTDHSWPTSALLALAEIVFVEERWTSWFFFRRQPDRYPSRRAPAATAPSRRKRRTTTPTSIRRRRSTPIRRSTATSCWRSRAASDPGRIRCGRARRRRRRRCCRRRRRRPKRRRRRPTSVARPSRSTFATTCPTTSRRTRTCWATADLATPTGSTKRPSNVALLLNLLRCFSAMKQVPNESAFDYHPYSLRNLKYLIALLCIYLVFPWWYILNIF